MSKDERTSPPPVSKGDPSAFGLLVAVAMIVAVIVPMAFRTEIANWIGVIPDSDLAMREQMDLNDARYENACISWRGAVNLLEHPLDPAAYTDYRGIVEPNVFNKSSLKERTDTTLADIAQADAELTALREQAGWSLPRSWLVGAAFYTHYTRRCTHPDEDDRPVVMSTDFFR